MIIIPARVASSRFPNKVLADLGGIPMVVATARAVASVDDTAVATDSSKVADICAHYGIKAVMTSSSHQSGTDRINEAATHLGLDDEAIILNVQADEPFIEPEVVKSLKELTKKHRNDPDVMICSAYKKINSTVANDPNMVKVVINECGKALYFSRSPIPYDREGGFDGYRGHIGIYGYTKKMLERFCSLAHAPLEHTEKLEQLRALSHGYDIAMIEVDTKSFGIDTPEDLKNALKLL